MSPHRCSRGAVALVLFLALGCASSAPQEPLPATEVREQSPWEPDPERPVQGTFQGLMGYRRYKDDLGSVGRGQVPFEMVVDVRPNRWLMGLELGTVFAVGSSSGANAYYDYLVSGSFEFYLGPRVDVEPLRGVHLYGSAGGTWLWIESEYNPSSFVIYTDADSTFSPYARVGLAYDIGEGAYLVVDGRFVFNTDIDLFGEEVDADFWQATVGAGVRF